MPGYGRLAGCVPIGWNRLDTFEWRLRTQALVARLRGTARPARFDENLPVALQVSRRMEAAFFGRFFTCDANAAVYTNALSAESARLRGFSAGVRARKACTVEIPGFWKERDPNFPAAPGSVASGHAIIWWTRDGSIMVDWVQRLYLLGEYLQDNFGNWNSLAMFGFGGHSTCSPTAGEFACRETSQQERARGRPSVVVHGEALWSYLLYYTHFWTICHPSLTRRMQELATATLDKGRLPFCALCGIRMRCLTCTACGNVSYCSVKHQRAHWKQGHRFACKGIVQSPASTSSSAAKVLASQSSSSSSMASSSMSSPSSSSSSSSVHPGTASDLRPRATLRMPERSLGYWPQCLLCGVPTSGDFVSEQTYLAHLDGRLHADVLGGDRWRCECGKWVRKDHAAVMMGGAWVGEEEARRIHLRGRGHGHRLRQRDRRQRESIVALGRSQEYVQALLNEAHRSMWELPEALRTEAGRYATAPWLISFLASLPRAHGDDPPTSIMALFVGESYALAYFMALAVELWPRAPSYRLVSRSWLRLARAVVQALRSRGCWEFSPWF